MSVANATCEGLWRASAMEAVAYADTDFPEVLLTHPELYDGGINQGNASHIRTTYEYLPNGKVRCTTEDNGQGIFLGLSRFCTWAAPSSVSTHHRYGHGTKKYLTKAQPDYATSDWILQWRDKKEPTFLKTIRGPYRGIEMEYLKSEDSTDTTTLAEGGTRFIVDISKELFHSYATVDDLFAAEKEIICSRHPKQIDNGSVEFTLTVKNGEVEKTENSVANGWLSLRAFLDSQGEEVVKQIFDDEMEIDGGVMTFAMYHVFHEKKKVKTKPLATAFPVYGRRNMLSSRVHISLDGRMIEARHLYKILGRESNHNDFNGYIGFVNFVPTTSADFKRLPEPATTKVKFSDECPMFQAAVSLMVATMDANKPKKEDMSGGELPSWKNLIPPSIKARIPALIPAPFPTPTPAPTPTLALAPVDPLTILGISIELNTTGQIIILAKDHEKVTFNGTALERDIMRKYATKKTNAADAYITIMDLMTIFTR